MTDPFVTLVAELRRAQRAWFGGDKSPDTYRLCRALEGKVDRALRDLAEPDRRPLFPEEPPCPSPASSATSAGPAAAS